VSLAGKPVGEVSADAAGAFRVPVEVGSLGVGNYPVAGVCGPILNTSLNVVLTSRITPATSTIAIIVFFLLIGAAIYRRRLWQTLRELDEEGR
jgi:hypothetical protein